MQLKIISKPFRKENHAKGVVVKALMDGDIAVGCLHCVENYGVKIREVSKTSKSVLNLVWRNKLGITAHAVNVYISKY